MSHLIDRCSFCGGNVRTERVRCTNCHIAFEGEFTSSRLALLPWEMQQFIEQFILSSGSLKEMENKLDVTYPTVRSRLDNIIEVLKERITIDDKKTRILDDLEQGKISASKATELLKNSGYKKIIFENSVFGLQKDKLFHQKIQG